MYWPTRTLQIFIDKNFKVSGAHCWRILTKNNDGKEEQTNRFYNSAINLPMNI